MYPLMLLIFFLSFDIIVVSLHESRSAHVLDGEDRVFERVIKGVVRSYVDERYRIVLPCENTHTVNVCCYVDSLEKQVVQSCTLYRGQVWLFPS